MKRSILTIAIATMVGGLALSGVAQADILGGMSKIDGDQLSGNGSGSVNANCSDYSGQYDGATATLLSDQSGSSTDVSIEVEGARPDTHYTVWVRMKGKSHGTTFGGSPVTGGGATPLAPSSALGDLIADWAGPGNPYGGANSFFTDEDGKGEISLELDFPLEGGTYPFNRMSADDLAAAQAKRAAALASPTAIVDPREDNVGPGGTPFLIRVVSHCQDGLSHGMSPSVREPWFQYP